MKTVSILIPAYNHEKYIERTLDTIFNDYIVDLEVVIIDDGSTDSTVACIESWIALHPDFNIRVHSRPNKGVAATLNELIKMAHGKYVRLFSSDDLMVTGSTQALINCLENNKNARAVFSDVKVISSAETIVSESGLHRNGARIVRYATLEGLKKEVISNWAVSGPSVVIERSWFFEHGFYDEKLLIDDWFIYLKLVSLNHLIFMPGCVALYRLHDESTCRTTDPIRRINNLKSQMYAGQKSLALFNCSDYFLLQAECLVLKAKIDFLERNLFTCAQSLMLSVFFRFRSIL